MNKQASYKLLLLFQITISFLTGIFGNLLSAIINVNVAAILAITALLILASYVLTIKLLEQEGKFQVSNRHGLEKISNFLFNRVITAFPFFLILGGFFASFLIFYLPYAHSILLATPMLDYQGVYLFEFVNFLLGFLILLVFDSFKRDNALISSSSIAFAVGTVTSILLLEPDKHNISTTVISWLLSMILSVRLLRIRFFKAIVMDISEAITNLSKER